MSNKQNNTDAYCNGCDAFICDQLVTHDETCDRCGTPVVYFEQSNIGKKYGSVVWLSNQVYALFQQYEQLKIGRIELRELMINTTEQAKEMHKEETCELAFKVGRGQDYDDEQVRELAEIYYNETFTP
jgi:hypothetical protein